jgi:hypothetical protein
MANYTIIGGDKKEYGPVSAAEVRQWLAEGRLDRNSLMRQENDTEWRPLSTFLEFAPAAAPQPPNPPSLYAPARPGMAPEAAAAAVKGPAIALIVIGALSVLLALWSTADDLFFPASLEQTMATMSSLLQSFGPDVQKSLSNPQTQSMLQISSNPWVKIPLDILTLGLSVIILMGATRMLALRSYEFAFVAAIMVMIPCVTPSCCCLLGLPFGIWALMVLRKPGIRGCFH